MPVRPLSTRLLLAALVALVGLWIGLSSRHDAARTALLRADPERVLGDSRLRPVALGIGHRVFAANCAACHGADGRGRSGTAVPDLTGAARLYGDGTVAEIEWIARHGIRSGDPKGWHLAAMPAYARARPYAGELIPPMTPREIADVTQYLLAFTARATDAAAAARGHALYAGKGGCWDCHGPAAKGETAIGAPDLTGRAWLYGGDAAAISRSLAHGRAGVCPAFARRLPPAELRAVAVYVASLRRPG